MREIVRRRTPPLSERLLRSVDKCSRTGCWNWNLCIQKRGYGVVGINQRATLAHRASYMEFVGEIPDGLCVLHKCDNRRCINPKHLFLGTKGDNAEDRKRKGRCAKGERNGSAVLTKENVIEIRSSSKSAKELSEKFNVGTSAIYDVRTGRTWGWLK